MILSNVNNTVPINWAETQTGLLFGATGLGSMFKWDGLAATVVAVGVLSPPDAPTLTFSGGGGATGTITNASTGSPIVITSAGHGRVTGERVTITGVLGNTAANGNFQITVVDANTFSLNGTISANTYTSGGTWSTSNLNGSYTGYLRFVDNLGQFSNPSPVSASATATNNSTLTYSNLDLPAAVANNPLFNGTTDITKITRRQLLRNTNGQASTYFVDIDTTDLTSTSLTSSNTDAQLTALTPVPSTTLFNYGIPPRHKWVIANHLGRMFAAVEVQVDQGCMQVVNGSTLVTPINGLTTVTPILVGRNLYVSGAPQAYQITGVVNPNVVNQGQYVLTSQYQGPTDPFASYAIRPTPDQRRLIYYSQPNLPEAWPATNAISVEPDGDDITGLMPFGSFLYILEQRHVYRFTFQTDPFTDGFIYLALNRGCINQRCWVTVEGTAYMLDDQGIHAYAGARESEPISAAVQDLFRFSDSPLRVNWAAQRWFHAVHFPSQETIRWFVAMSGQYLPYHAITYNYRQKRWWIEEWATNIGASCLGRLGKLQQTPQVYLGTTSGRVVAMWQGTLDGPDPTEGRVRGAVSVPQGVDGFTDTTAVYAAGHVINNPVVIVDGTGKGQRNIVTGTSPLQVKWPWLVTPDKTSVYQLGGIPWQVQFGWWRMLMYEDLHERYFALVFQTCSQPALATLQVFTDFSSTPTIWKGDWTLNDGNGVRTVAGAPDIVLDFTKPSGYVMKRLPHHKEFFIDGPRYLSFAISGVTNQDQQRLYYATGGGLDQGG